MRKIIPLVLVLIFIVAFFLGISTLDSQYMWSDEVYSFHAAKMILEKGKPIYDSGLVYGRSPLYHNLLALSMEIFGVNEFGSRVLNIPFILGTSTILGIFIYQLLREAKVNRNTKIYISILTGLIYYISNFATAMMRETRMYGMSTFFLVFSVYLLYTAIINPPKKGLLKIKWLNFDFNLYYAIAFLPIFYIAYEVQPINILLGLGVLLFFVLSSIIEKKYKQILIAIGILLTGILVIYLKFDTLNLLVVFKELSPDWANGITPLFYSILTVKNLPFVLITAPLTVYLIFKNRDIHAIYLGSIVVAFLMFLSLQEAQHERYWQAVVPIIILISVYSVVLFKQEFKHKWVRTTLTIFITISLLFHSYLAVKEYSEIDTYTQSSLSIHKKLQYNKIFTYLDTNLKDNDLLIGDFHSAYTLYEKGYGVDYLVLPDNDVNWVWGKYDLYFDIPLLKYSELESFISNNNGYLVIRDFENIQNLKTEKINEFVRPILYKF